MPKHLKLSYYAPSDTLYLDWAEPNGEQASRSIAKGVLARVNPKTSAVETLEVLNFVARFSSDKLLDIPLEGSAVGETRLSYGRGGGPTQREFTVVQLISEGRTTREIAEVLQLKEQSIKKLVRVAMAKLHVEIRRETPPKLAHAGGSKK